MFPLPLRLTTILLTLALATFLTSCALNGKKPAVPAVPAAPAPTANPPAPPQPLSIPQTQVEIPPPQPVSPEALAAGQTPPEEPEPAAPPRPVRHTAPPPVAPHAETPPAAEEPARAPIQEVLSIAERKQLQDSTAERIREIRRLVDLARRRRLNTHEISVVTRVDALVKLSGDAEAKGDLREADALAQRALVLAKDLDSER